ncbi:MAG: flippase-like domain-containing protein [Actinomycetota bacterium]|nr:flippase-like domain-containing protein [Actinomycetota bacterium]
MKRRILFWVALAAAVWLVATHTADITRLWQVMRGGDPRWLVGAALLQVAYYAFYIWTFKASFEAVGIQRPYGELAPVVLGSIFVNVVTPTGGTAGPALVVDDAVRRGHSPAGSAAAMVLTQVVDFASFAVIMTAGFIYLGVSGRLKAYEVAAAAVLIALIALFAGALVLAFVRPSAFVRVLGWVARRVRGVWGLAKRPSPLADDWAERTAAEFTASARMLAERPRGVVKAGVIGVAGYGLDLLGLMAVGFAFGWDKPASLLAAYAVGVLVWIVSIVPQGIGVVEGAIAVVLVSFGAALPQATAISLVFRGMSFWLPLLLGFLLLRRVSTFQPARRSEGAETFAVRAAAVMAALVGVIDVLSAVTPSIRARVLALEAYLPVHVHYGHLSAAIAGLGLIFLSRGLWRRKRSAWVLAVVLLATSVISHLVKGLDYEEAMISGAFLVWLLTEHAAFHARPDGPSLMQGLRVLAAAAIGTVAYGTAGFYLLDRHYALNFGLWAAVRQTVVMFTQFYDPGLAPLTRFGRFFADSIYIVGIIAFGYAVVMLLRPVLLRAPSTPAEQEHATGIVERWGCSSLAAMTLLPDKTYHFSPGGSVIAYALENGFALSLGDPIGPPGDFGAAIADFKAVCSRNGWTPIFYQTLPDDLPAYEAAGFKSIKVGHEAVIDLTTFSMAGGGSRKNMRNRIKRLEEEGYSAVVHDPPIAPALMRELKAVSDGWLTRMHGTEQRYSLGWFLPEYISSCPIMTVHAPDGRVVAFANILSEYQRPESTIDLMRHLPEAPSGTMDFMFVRLLEWCRELEGCESFNLGLSPLADVGRETGDPAAEKVLRLVYDHIGQFYNFQGLHSYKEKFDPRWEPRYLVFPNSADLPGVFYALVSADTGEGVVMSYLKNALRKLRTA